VDIPPEPSRRDALRFLGVGTLAALVAACGGNDKSSSAAATTSEATEPATTSTTAAAAGAQTCVLTPEMTEGPYYLAGEADRSDVTEGRPGTPLQLDFVVVDAAACRPIPGAIVEIWHADAAGDYSGFGNGASSRTFLRGGQTADARGNTTFRTIYPGWYQGRAVHIHLKVHVDGATHTSQLFFDETVTDLAYAQTPYSTRTGQRTLNSQDGIYQGGGSTTTVRPARSGDGYEAALTLAVQR
jgi:protocatechuate 3,4-dioxygenase beta subunit